MPNARLSKLIAELGYEASFRGEVWVECFVSRGDERWIGRGRTEEEALADTVRAMLPSELGRRLLADRLEAPARLPEPPPAEPPPPAPPAPAAAAAAAAAAAPAAAPAPAPAPAPADSAPRRAAPPPDPDALRHAALGAIDALLAEIETSMPKLAALAPERQRLVVLELICRARAHEDQCPGDRDVAAAIGRVARRLTDFCKTFWPGNVRALSIATTASRAAADLGQPATSARWGDVARAATASLERLAADGRRDGLDDAGWADAVALKTPPKDPAALFDLARKRVVELTGPIEARPADDAELGGSAAPLEEAARAVRWVRGRVDPVAWGLVVGRLRWAASRAGVEGTPLRDALDPRKRRSGWGQPFSSVPKAAEKAAQGVDREKRLGVLRDKLPPSDAPRAALVVWLGEAFADLDNPTIARLLEGRADEVLALGDDDPALDRGARSRLRKLRTWIERQRSGATAAEETPPAEDREEEGAESGTANPVLVSLCALVRPQTDGKRALLVSNRDDGELARRLETLLGLDLEVCAGAPRRVQSQCERIAQRSYDLVLVATGFQDHATEGMITRSAKNADVKVVRANRARPLACVQAIAREYGLTIG